MEAKPEDVRRGQAVVRVLGCVLEKLVSASALEPSGADLVTKFHSQKLPGISIREYLERIQKYAYCSTECFVLALIYIDRLIQRNGFMVTALNVHRVVITSVLLAAKFFDDQYFNNAHYAKVGGLPLSEMNALEVEFCFRINFSLQVADVVYLKYHTELAQHAKMCSSCGACIPCFPKLNPYTVEEPTTMVPLANGWHAGEEAMEVSAADLGAGPARGGAAPLAPCLASHGGVAPFHHSAAMLEYANPAAKAAFGAMPGYDKREAPVPMLVPQKMSTYPPILDQCISTWGVPPPLAAGPMYYPLYYS